MANPNIALARRWFDEVWNQRRTETIDELLAPDSVGHTEAGDVVGPAAFKETIHAPLLAAIPDLKISVDDLIADGDNAVVRWSARGTHRGDVLGARASGKHVTFHGITWIRFRDGKMVEGWDAWNQLPLFQQSP
jgi:steroid delta-isomerase-like uncharacterized protein